MPKALLIGAAIAIGALSVSPIPGSAHAATAATTSASAMTTASSWLSGASGNGVATGDFATWRSRPVDIAGTWSDNNSASLEFWQLQKGFEYANWTKPIDVAVGAIDPGETWQKAAAGAYDARWTKSLQKLASLRSGAPGTTYIRFAHEMNGNWYPWSVNTTNYTAFDTSWKRYRALQQRYFPTAKLVFSVNRESVGAGMDWRRFFPGRQYVDVLSVDYYNQWPYVSTASQWTASLGTVDSFGAPKGLATHLAFAANQGLPLAISEWSGKASNGDSPEYISDLLTFVKDHAGSGSGQILYEILFNVGGYSNDFALYGKGASMPKSSAAYRAFFTSQSASASSGSGATPAPPASAATKEAAAVRAAATATAATAARATATVDRAASGAATSRAAAAAARASSAAATVASAEKRIRALKTGRSNPTSLLKAYRFLSAAKVELGKASASATAAAATAAAAGTKALASERAATTAEATARAAQAQLTALS